MAIKVFKNVLDDFWHDHNLKLVANPFFLEDCGDFYVDVWCLVFKKNGSVTTLDFSLFDLPAFQLESIAIYFKDGHEYPLNCKEFAKLACLTMLTPTNGNSIKPTYQMMLHLFAFLKRSNESVLTQALLEDFWTSFMGCSVNQEGFFNRISPPSYQGNIGPVPLHRLRNELKAKGVVGVIDSKLTLKSVAKSLDEVCQSLYSTTLTEFKKGGSFNFLGLELGQYYVDYLNSVYQQNFLYTSVCKKTFVSIFLKHDMKSLDDSSTHRLNKVMLSGLQGTGDCKPTAYTKGINHSALERNFRNELFEAYLNCFESIMALNECNIEALVIELGLTSRSDAVELVRVLMLQKYWGLDGHKSSKQVWQGYLLSLNRTFIESESLHSVTIDDVYEKMQMIINEQKLGKSEFLADIGKWATGLLACSDLKDYQSFKALLDIQVHAMTNLVVAWTGYRQSEFGFPLRAIQTEPNMDILDNAHVPFRFKLKWFVPKTNGSTKIYREITSQCYQIAAQLNELFGHVNNEPCLYTPGENAKNESVHKSEGYISHRVKANWRGFVETYQPFNDVIALDELLKNKSGQLTALEREKLSVLLSKYHVSSTRYKHLLSTAKEVKKDWLRLSVSMFVGTNVQKTFKQSLVQYTRGDAICSKVHQQIIDTYLSDETRYLLTSGTINLNDKKTMLDIRSEILEGARYPSPHAFRHIWAEAVLTRYQGDVGAVIRHHFCHLDNSFFMAYLREKDARGLMKSAKQRYLNSVIEFLITETEQIGTKYVGGMARFVKKSKSLTQVKSESELVALREVLAGCIIDIQANTFAMCIPRDGGESRAKCAKIGSLNSQDAKPEFCLNCTNALITEGNIRGIWQVIQPMVKEAQQPQALGFLLEAHLPALQSGGKRIKALRSDSNADSVDKILSEIYKAIDIINRKVKQEEALYG